MRPGFVSVRNNWRPMSGPLGHSSTKTKGTGRVHAETRACNSFQIKKKEWCRRGESNPRPRDYETLALPLSYAGVRQFSIVRSNREECQAHQAARLIRDFAPV